MKRIGFVLAAGAFVFAASACGPRNGASDGNAGPDPGASPTANTPQLVEGTGTVLESKEHGPELCLGVVLDSLPPQCGGPRLVGWDWNRVSAEESAAGTTWGEYHVRGTYDGSTLTVVDAGPPQGGEGNDDPIETPCPEPEGGWTAPDPDRWSRAAVDETSRVARKDPAFAGLWLDYIAPFDEDADEDPEDIILTVAFTDEPESHEDELRATWGGPLCLVHRAHTERELLELQGDAHAVADEELGLEVTYSDVNIVEGFVEIGVVFATAESQGALDERYGEGVVKLDPALRPVQD